jgi:ribosomal protein S27AE
MTMRVWVSEIDTVIFGKDDVRQLTGMRGLQGTADDLAAELKAFGETRSMVVAPTSGEDLARAQQVGAMSQILGGAHSEAKNALLTAALGAIAAPTSSMKTTTDIAIETQRFCAQCGAPAAHDARFCGKCGTALAV